VTSLSAKAKNWTTNPPFFDELGEGHAEGLDTDVRDVGSPDDLAVGYLQEVIH